MENKIKEINTFFFINSIIILSLIASCREPSLHENNDAPNLLFIFPDQFRNAAVGINKEDPVYTPNMDLLAEEGIIISNAISNFPLCSPYRAMLMTGKLPYNNKVLSNCNSNRYKYNNSWQKDDISFSDVLVKNGYDAGYVGKLHLTSPAPIAGSDSVLWDAYTPKEERHGFNFWCSYGTFNQHNEPHYWINDAKEDELIHVDEWSPTYEANVIIDYIQNKDGKIRDQNKPFALFWSVNPPHPPYQYVPEKYLAKYADKSLDELLIRKNVALDDDASELGFHKGATTGSTHLAKEHVRNYFAMVTGVDDQIGRVLEALKNKGLSDNTIVVVSADHGDMMGSHGLMSKNIWYEESINVPLIIRWPKAINAGQNKDYLVSVTDLMPTLLNMMGSTIGLPSNLDGRDLSSLLLRDEGKSPEAALYYYIEEGRPESGHRGLRTLTHTYVVTVDDEDQVRKFLYDNTKDPFQLVNTINSDHANEKRLHQLLITSLEEKKDPWLQRYSALEMDNN